MKKILQKVICDCCLDFTTSSMDFRGIGKCCPECFLDLIIISSQLNHFQLHGYFPDDADIDIIKDADE